MILKKCLRKLFKIMVILVLLLIAISFFLANTKAGLHLDLFVLKKLSGNSLQIKKANGTISKKFTLSDVSYANKEMSLHIGQLNASIPLFDNVFNGLTLKDIEINQVTLKLHPTTENKAEKKQAIKAISSQQIKQTLESILDLNHISANIDNTLQGLKFNLDNITICQLKIENANDTPIIFETVHVNAKANGSTIEIKNISVQSANQQAHIEGQIELNKNTDSTLNFIASGPIQLQGHLSRKNTSLSLEATIEKPFSTTASFHLNQDKSLQGKLSMVNGRWPFDGEAQIFIPTFHFEINGTTSNYQLTFNGKFLNQVLSGQAHFNGQTKSTMANIKLGENKISITGDQTSPFTIKLDVQHLATLHPALSALQASVTGIGVIDTTSSLKLLLSPGKYNIPDSAPLNFNGGTITLVYSDQSANITGNLSLTQSKNIIFNASLPKLFEHSIEQQNITANLELHLDAINEIENFVSELSHTQGQLQAKVNISGLLLSPHVQVNAQLLNATTQISGLNILLEKINLTVNGTPANYTLNGSAQSGAGQLNIQGTGSLHSSKQFSNTINLNGQQVTLFNTDEYKVAVSPSVRIQISPEQLFLDGNINLDSANISPHDFSSTVELPEDVVVVGSSHERGSTLPIGYQLHINIGEHTTVAVEGLKGNLKGKLDLNAPIHQVTRATGSLYLTEATYKAYGQDLKVEEGKLVYAGGPINNPSLFIKAIRTFKTTSEYSPDLSLSQGNYTDDLTVGLNVTGRLKNPKVTLFSDPADKSQADILSFLVLGKPLAQSSNPFADNVDNGSQLLISAMSALNLQGGTTGMQLTEQLKHAFGLDNLGLETQNTYDSETNTVSESTALVLSKSLSSRLSMQYSIGLAQGANILKIKYQLNPRWAIQTETNGATNGVDILFNYHK